ncbi:MAG: hypothetical protein J6A01_10795 [Proteobacteria bacterium]|nr:hypothetical protein [Pseudomonadota bacterium]
MKKRFGLCFALLCVFGMTSCDDSGSDKAGGSYQDGAPCDTSTFEQTCEGNVLIVCYNSKIERVNCSGTCASFAQPAKPESCDEEDEDCKAQQSLGNSSCFASSKYCSVENEVVVRCETAPAGITRMVTYQCQKSLDGRMFYRWLSSEQCYNGYGVCSADNKCLEPIVCENGYETHCEGNILKKCNKNRLRASDCASYTTPRVCSVIDEVPQCLSPEDECTTEGEEIVTGCIANSGKERLSVCTRAENGKLYYNSAGTRLCQGGCNEDATACKPVSCPVIGAIQKKCRLQGTSITYEDTYTCTERDGASVFVLTASEKCDNGHGTCSEDGQCIPAENCETKSFESRCDDSTAVNCTSKKVRYNHCDLASTPKICAVVDDKAKCFSDSEICSAGLEDQILISSCNATYNKEFLKKCTKAKDGNFYYVSAGSRECANGCNAEGTRCN